jgi:hypothetical protein
MVADKRHLERDVRFERVAECGAIAAVGNGHHDVCVDGVFTRDDAGTMRFLAGRSLTHLDVVEVLAIVVPRVRALLVRRGVTDDEAVDEDVWGDAAPTLAAEATASVQGLVAGGGRLIRPLRIGTEVRLKMPDGGPWGTGSDCHARADGFDLHAGVRVPAGQPERLERLCRYVLRPPVASDALAVTPQGRVRLARHPWRDGTTHLVLEPRSFLGRLAVLVPVHA